MGNYDHIGLTLDESLTGWIGAGKTDPVDGRMHGRMMGTELVMTSRITITSLSRFLEQPDHACRLEGNIDFAPLGRAMPMRDGVFNVFVVDRRSGERQMVYEACFVTQDGTPYFLRGVKHIHDDPGFDILEDMTTLFTTIYEGYDDRGKVYGAGQLFFKLATTPQFIASLDVTGETWFGQALAAKVAFLSFVYGHVRDTYLADLNPIYDATYQNVVLRGRLKGAGPQSEPFFLVSGIHSPNFPWGDGETFCDLLMIVGDADNHPKRYAISARRLEGHEVDVRGGTLAYDGPIFDVTDMPVVSFSEMNATPCSLVAGRVKLNITFGAKVHPLAPFPFRINSEVLDRVAYRIRETLRKLLPSEHQFGFEIVPSSLSDVAGTVELSSGTESASLAIVSEETLGEGEDSTIRNVREPTLLYGYICAIRETAKAARVQFHTSTLRNEREYWGKDQLDGLFGAVISRFGSKDLDIRSEGVTITDLAVDGGSPPAPLFERIGECLLDVRNDHFPTAVFQRRIIRVKDPSGETCFALEEAMDPLRRSAVDCDREAVVAAIHGEDKFATLDKALQEANFWSTLESTRARTGKAKPDFAIVIKPNFMFAYNKHDTSTYTDPELVEAFVSKLVNEGYTSVTVAEAQSTYGQYFANRGVLDVAKYIGYVDDGSRHYQLLDLSEDEQEQEHFGPALGYHPVPKTWKNADFRISFAKNKTHCYAFYTLTIKNVYGALSLGNKFKEYHCDRGIYATTIEYLRAYPVHFGIIDAWLSADGPFGIFADSDPVRTHTILAGSDLVAVDWVGASKMGMDPKISKFMQLAIKAFGKPRILLKGDASVYHPWLNVPMALSMATNLGLDANHYFGNLFYMSTAYMDSAQFPLSDRSAFLHGVRSALRPLQEAVFLTPEGHRTRANKAVGRLLRWLAD